MFKKILRYFFDPMPSFFDVCVGGLLLYIHITVKWGVGLFFVFYTIFLFVLSFSMTPKREYKSKALTLFVLWALINMFIHSFAIYPTSQMMYYLNFYMMVEGFIYVLSVAIFITTVIKYSTNTRYIYILLPFSMIAWFPNIARAGSTTPVAALGVAVVIYLLLSKRWILSSIAILGGLIMTILNWSWICFKFACRPVAWKVLVMDSFYHPVKMFQESIVDPGITLSPWLETFLTNHLPNFTNMKPWFATIFGAGFAQWLNANYLFVVMDDYGWLYRHSDYGALAVDLGPIALGLMLWFLFTCLKRIGIRPSLIIFMMILLTCGFQVTMYLPKKMFIFLMMGVVVVTEKKEEA